MSFTCFCDSKLIDFIQVYEHLFPEDLCDDIVDEYKDDKEWSRSSIGPKAEVKDDVRTSSSLFISHPSTIEKNIIKRKQLDSRILDCLGFALKKYKSTFSYTCSTVDNGYHLLRYTPNQHYKEHNDYFSIVGSQVPYESFKVINSREISCVVTLSSAEKDFTGGGTSFFGDTHRITASKGTVLMFPSSFMFPHQALPVISGTRYSLVTWFA